MGEWRFCDGGDARVFLKGSGDGEAVVLFAESGEEPGGEDWSRTGKFGEQLIIREHPTTGCNFGIEAGDAGGQRT